MLTEQTTEATTATASRDHTQFVTAARWLRNNGWRPDVTTFGTCREMRWRKDADTISVVFAQGVTLRLQGVRGTWLQLDDPTSVAQAIDFLVVAKVLPPLVVVDCTADRWELRPDGRYTYTYDDGDIAVMTRDELDRFWGPISAVQS